MDLHAELSKIFKGELDVTDDTREFYSHDASLFELKPQIVGFPKDADDIKNVVRFVNENKAKYPELNITPRSRGTDMSGAAIGESILLDISKNMNKLHEVTATTAHVQPGMLYREFDVETLKLGSILPSYPASRDLASVGGMVNNNSGGEKSLQYGKTDNFVTELKVVLSDGNEYTVVPLTREQLNAKIDQGDFEGNLYQRTFELLDQHYDEIQAARPKVSKDSTGYHLWNVWNRDTGIFDLTKLFVGAQGTLGIVTDIKVNLVPAPKHSGTLVIFLKNIEQLGDIINEVLKHKPMSFEGFDNHTLWLSFKLFFYFQKTLGWWGMIKLGLQLLPDALLLFRSLPQMVLLVEFTADTQEEVTRKVHEMRLALHPFDSDELYEEDDTEAKARKFWIMRRESFNLLRKKVRDKHTAPYIDDMIVPPERLPEFLPELRVIIKKYKLLATIQGHFGDGNFHVIPLMKIEDQAERDKLLPSQKEVNELVLKYGGSISGEHNDGMVRGQWLEQMYGPSVLGFMKDIKQLYDPKNIFNPHKKTDANWDFSYSHIRKHF